MDIQPQTTQAMSDDQELAKVLAGVNQQGDDEGLKFEETPVTGSTPAAATPVTTAPLPADTIGAKPAEEPEVAPIIGYNPPSDTDMPSPSTSASPTGDLEDIKKEALGQLRPLVDKLDLAPDEKFDTYLLLLRSTDDKALIPSAYAAAQAITDETRKAQALLDVIKEIDYLSTPK